MRSEEFRGEERLGAMSEMGMLQQLTPKKIKTTFVLGYAGPMNYLSPHLARLRQEITDLRNMNVLYAQQSAHSAVEKTASDVRASRLLQIQEELSKMRDCPPEPWVWWDKVRKPKRAA